jgi:hypothetical protein
MYLDGSGGTNEGGEVDDSSNGEGDDRASGIAMSSRRCDCVED